MALIVLAVLIILPFQVFSLSKRESYHKLQLSQKQFQRLKTQWSSPPWANAQRRFSDELASLLRPRTRCKESGDIKGSPTRLNSACTESASCPSSCMAQSVGHCHGRTFGVWKPYIPALIVRYWDSSGSILPAMTKF